MLRVPASRGAGGGASSGGRYSALLPHSSSHPSSSRKGHKPDGSRLRLLVVLVPALFFGLALVACIVFLRSAPVAPDLGFTDPLASAPTDSVARGVIPSAALLSSAPAIDDADSLVPLTADSLARESAHWESLFLRGASSLGGLEVALTAETHRAPAAPPAAQSHELRGTAVVGRERRSSSIPYTPGSPLVPPEVSWVAGLPDYRSVFLRDAFVSALLLLSSPESKKRGGGQPWDLAALVPEADVDGGDGAGAPDLPGRGVASPALIRASPATRSAFLSLLHPMRSALLTASRTQGSRLDPRTGEQHGRVGHELPGKIVSHTATSASSTRFASADSTALFVLAAASYICASNDWATLRELAPALARGWGHIQSKIDKPSGLVIEDPPRVFGPEWLGALKVESWKDSVLLRRPRGGGRPSYPAAFMLGQAQTLAAVRALHGMQELIATQAQLNPRSVFPAIQAEWTAAFVDQPDWKAEEALLLRGMNSYFFRRPAAAADAAGDEGGAEGVAAASDQVAPILPLPSATSSESACPFWGLDSLGSLGRSFPLVAGEEELVSSDLLQALFYLREDDLTPEEAARWFGGGESRQGDVPWTPPCVESLRSTVGVVTSSLDRRPSVAGSSVLSSSGNSLAPGSARAKEVAYRHSSVWGFEQALIHRASRLWGLRSWSRTTSAFFRALDRSTPGAASGVSAWTAEYFLPATLSPPPSFSAPPRARISPSSSSPSAPSSPASPNADEWVAQGSLVQLWSVAAQMYWASERYAKLQRRAEREAPVRRSADAPRSSPLDRSPCVLDEARVVRGLHSKDQWRACPSAPSTSAATAYPASVFVCFDHSAVLWLSAVNDDYCDCADGSDERGTSACAHSDEERGFQAAKFPCAGGRGEVHASLVDDGVCDCCDGSDERDSGAHCANTC